MELKNDISFSEIMKKQQILREVHQWDPHIPENGMASLLWTYDEMGEVTAILKKKGWEGIMNDESVRSHFLEECADVMMYFFDMMDCYQVTPEEFAKAYREKNERNMNRSWSENIEMYEDRK